MTTDGDDPTDTGTAIVETLEELGVDGFVTKPIDTDELISLVDSSKIPSLIEREA